MNKIGLIFNFKGQPYALCESNEVLQSTSFSPESNMIYIYNCSGSSASFSFGTPSKNVGFRLYIKTTNSSTSVSFSNTINWYDEEAPDFSGANKWHLLVFLYNSYLNKWFADEMWDALND